MEVSFVRLFVSLFVSCGGHYIHHIGLCLKKYIYSSNVWRCPAFGSAHAQTISRQCTSLLYVSLRCIYRSLLTLFNSFLAVLSSRVGAYADTLMHTNGIYRSFLTLYISYLAVLSIWVGAYADNLTQVYGNVMLPLCDEGTRLSFPVPTHLSSSPSRELAGVWGWKI